MKFCSHKIDMLLLVALIALLTLSCAQREEIIDVQMDQSDVREFELPGGGRARVKAGGWAIPNLNSVDGKVNFKVPGAKTLDGIEVSNDSVDATKYRPVFGMMLVNPDIAATIGLGDLNVQSVSEYKSKGRTFAFKYDVNQVQIDKDTNMVTSSRGVIFSFALYDEDGDGTFEMLASDEPSVYRRMRPHVPAWVIREESKASN